MIIYVKIIILKIIKDLLYIIQKLIGLFIVFPYDKKNMKYTYVIKYFNIY